MEQTDASQVYIRPNKQTRYPMSRSLLRKVAEDAGAVCKVGKAVMYNTELIDKYLAANCKGRDHE